MNDDALSDAALLSAATQGDAAAFSCLVRRHIRPATLLAAQLLGDRDDAEDIVQQAFTIVYEKAHAFESGRPFPPWLYGIVRRLAANRRARDARRARLLRLWGRRDATGADPEQRMFDRLEAESARAMLEQLSPMQRACFELVALRDLPVEQVAELHHISESTVRQHVFRARKALRGRLNDGHAADREE